MTDISLQKHFEFEDNLESILGCDKKTRRKLEENRYLSLSIFNCFGMLILESDGLKLNDAVYSVTNDFAYEFNYRITKKVHNYVKNRLAVVLPLLKSKGYISFVNGKYYITEAGKSYKKYLKMANRTFSLCYDSPYKDYFMFYMNNMSITYLSLSRNNDLASMCKDYEFSLESFNFFLERLINSDVLNLIDKDIYNVDEDRYSMDKEFYYQLILLLAVRGYNVLS